MPKLLNYMELPKDISLKFCGLKSKVEINKLDFPSWFPQFKIIAESSGRSFTTSLWSNAKSFWAIAVQEIARSRMELLNTWEILESTCSIQISIEGNPGKYHLDCNWFHSFIILWSYYCYFILIILLLCYYYYYVIIIILLLLMNSNNKNHFLLNLN